MGVLFALFVNKPVHALVFDVLYYVPVLAGGAMSEALVTTVFGGLGGTTSILSFAGVSTVLLSPFIEELTDRGIILRESSMLPLWQAAVISFIVFSMSHYATGGMPKVLAIAPAALLFVGVRVWTGSFVYSAIAHAGMNMSALVLPKL